MIEMIVYLQDYTYFQFIPFWHRKSILILRPELHPLAPSAARSVPVVASLRRHFWHAGREGYKTRSWWGNLWKPCSYKNWNGTNLLRIPNTFWEQALGRWRRWIPRKLLLEEGSIEWLPARRASSLASQEPLAKMTWSQVVALYQWHVASPTTADHCMKMKKKHGKTSLAFAACLSRTLMRTHIRFKSDSRDSTGGATCCTSPSALCTIATTVWFLSSVQWWSDEWCISWHVKHEVVLFIRCSLMSSEMILKVGRAAKFPCSSASSNHPNHPNHQMLQAPNKLIWSMKNPCGDSQVSHQWQAPQKHDTRTCKEIEPHHRGRGLSGRESMAECIPWCSMMFHAYHACCTLSFQDVQGFQDPRG